MSKPPRERWSSKLGAILAVSSAAVGLGNFLRFPGKAAAYGGGAFMVPYFVSLLVLGIPIAWAEWTIGRYGGSRGFHSAPGIFRSLWKHRLSPYVGSLSLIVPFAIYVYYVFIEGWCLGYAWLYATGEFPLRNTSETAYSDFFNAFVGAKQHGAILATSPGRLAVLALVASASVNLALVYRGINKGIEAFIKVAMPLLLVLGIVLLIRVLTLGTPNPSMPDQNLWNGLGFMWNPRPHGGGSVWSAIWNPQVWLEAASQIFFTLGVAFGIIVCYASYVRKDDDIVLSSLTSCATNEFCEVCLGGLITLPAAFMFLGAAPLQHVLGSTLSLGFHTLPQVFEWMPAGRAFGFVWFLLLFLAAITSSIAMVHPIVAFLQEGLGLSKKAAVLWLTPTTLLGSGIVAYYSGHMAALDTFDFWAGSILIFVMGLAIAVVFAVGFDGDAGLAEANRGARFSIPRVYGWLLRWACPVYLLAILCAWLYRSAGPYLRQTMRDEGSRVALMFLLATIIGFVTLTHVAVRRWRRLEPRPHSPPHPQP